MHSESYFKHRIANPYALTTMLDKGEIELDGEQQAQVMAWNQAGDWTSEDATDWITHSPSPAAQALRAQYGVANGPRGFNDSVDDEILSTSMGSIWVTVTSGNSVYVHSSAPASKFDHPRNDLALTYRQMTTLHASCHLDYTIRTLAGAEWVVDRVHVTRAETNKSVTPMMEEAVRQAIRTALPTFYKEKRHVFLRADAVKANNDLFREERELAELLNKAQEQKDKVDTLLVRENKVLANLARFEDLQVFQSQA